MYLIIYGLYYVVNSKIWKSSAWYDVENVTFCCVEDPNTGTMQALQKQKQTFIGYTRGTNRKRSKWSKKQ